MLFSLRIILMSVNIVQHYTFLAKRLSVMWCGARVDQVSDWVGQAHSGPP